ncbi:serine/threonine-protein phosphatase 6 regulatory subunit 2 isoform X1 [Selaginella moellendorffii]|uniref:serine/threonine-protein phosphatase 6 regulatory subunit 2 isoform X1 n=1 Tax=Selaginella moellendorffii TaxID=88036 RepID=UPI000D1CDDC4|nr:serine/threonine-protein phosphatase 6 regulatory subunit 2 isoform X1 [Selaginella moellendorffii]|eukprot:XP_024522093.1 serine/threonine-protein phosphatase 6 regulatory subunit 2 isoform X1 [Selaginella moellendorffii]
MAGSFWGSNLPNMLESEECSLEEILNEDDVLQSCYRNQDLMKFLQNKDRMKKMISYAIVVPVHDDEKSYKTVLWLQWQQYLKHTGGERITARGK